MATKRTEQGEQKKRAYDKEYMRKYFKGKTITFNTKSEEDMAMLDWVKAQPEGGNKFIKRLIYEDMMNRKDV